jgi:FkbM family methyltransferase
MKKTLLEFAYKIETLASRCQGIASERPNWNGEYKVVARLGSSIRHAIDGGANLGEWTGNLLKHSPDARVLLAEPHPENAKHLRKLFFDRADKIGVHEVALAAEPGQVFLSAGADLGTGTGMTSSDPALGGWSVKATSLPELAQHFGSRCQIDFVKLDIEGDEMTVLRGAEPLFAAGRLGVVQVEYNCTWLDRRETLGGLFKFARHHDYVLLQLTPFGPMHMQTYGLGLEDYRLRNLLLVRRDLVNLLNPIHSAGRPRVEMVRNAR